MAAVTFDPVYFSLIVFLSAFIPGFAIGWPLLRKSGISLVEKLVLCFFAGMVLTPSLMFAENIFGIMFSLNLVFANILLIVLAGAFLWHREKAYEIKFKFPSLDEALSTERLLGMLPSILLIAAVFLAFWLRIITYTPIYSELDPYFYVYGSGQIIRFGEVPYAGHDDTAWWPEIKEVTHRNFPPMKMYLEAQWFSLYTAGAPYDNDILYLCASWLPPISAALMAFGAYLLFSTYFDRRYGVFAAFLTALLPVTVFKMAAGVNEAAPFGLASIFIVTGIYSLALRKKDVMLGLFAALAFFAIFTGSNYSSVLLYPLAGFVMLQSAIDFGFAKDEDKHKQKHEKKGGKALLMEIVSKPESAITILLFAGFLLGTLLQPIYSQGFPGARAFVSSSLFISLAAIGSIFLFGYLSTLGMPQKKRLSILAAAAVIGLLALVIPNPLGSYAKDQISTYIGAADFNVPLERTIAEQNRAGASFESEAGFIALVTRSVQFSATSASGIASQISSQGVSLPSSESSKLSQLQSYGGSATLYLPDGRVLLISKEGASFVAYLMSHQVSNPGGIKDIALNYIYFGLDILASISTFFGNIVFEAATSAFNIVLGKNIDSGAKDTSLLYFFLITATLGLLWDAFVRKAKGSEAATFALLLLLLILPISYIGMNKIKYTLLVGVALIVAATVTFGEIERLASKLAARAKIADMKTYVAVFFAGILFIVVIAEATIPSNFQVLILGKSAALRYQDNPVAAMPHMAAMCEALRARNYLDEEICAAGYNASFPDTINSQYNYKTCFVSQLEVDELFPGNDSASQLRSAEARSGASYRCNRLGDYWIESMEWMNANLPTDARVNSWWDYGHWTNYFGDRKTVLRNEHASKGMIGRVAHDFLIGSDQDLIDSMNYFDSQYVLFDVEIIGGDTFGAKYGALNYLGCAHEGETSVRVQQGTSKCEFEHSPEQIVIPKAQTPDVNCVISESQQRTGVVAYRITSAGLDTANPVYCIGDVTLATGEKITGTYYMDRKDANGDLVVSKGFVRKVRDDPGYFVAEIVYNNKAVWLGQGGTVVDGMDDAKSAFYRSNLYGAFYNEELPGFDLLFKSKGGEVKIYKMKDSIFKGNKEGWVDPSYINRTQ